MLGWGKRPLWEHDLAGGRRMLRMGVDTHLVTAHHALPLMLRTTERGLLVEMTDGTAVFNAEFRQGVGFYYDLVKANVGRIVLGLTHTSRALADTYGVTDADGSRPDCWGYIGEHGIDEQSGADVEEYR